MILVDFDEITDVTMAHAQLRKASGSKIGRGTLEVSLPCANQFQALQDSSHDYPHSDSSSSISNPSFVPESPICFEQLPCSSAHKEYSWEEANGTDKVRSEKGGLSPMMSQHVRVVLQGGKSSDHVPEQVPATNLSPFHDQNVNVNRGSVWVMDHFVPFARALG